MLAKAVVALLIIAAVTAAHSQGATGVNMKVQGESFVLAKTEPGNFCFDQVVKGSLTVRSTFVAGKAGSVVYEEGKDYVVDYAQGTLSRTAESRIPDYSTHILYGVKDFDHSKYTDWGNHKFFVWADYETTNGKPWALPNDQAKYLAAIRARLEAGGPFKIASYGDSITAGGEASEEAFRFQQRFGHYLQARFPKAAITVQDVSISGYTSQQGVDWFDKYMGTVDKPDLALVGFGMNDHNIGSVDLEKFKANLVEIVKMIRERKGAEVILFSAFPPNDNWHYGTHRMALYAAATKQAAAEANCAYVDVFSSWAMVLQRKDQSSLLGNNINHPNDFGHWLYEEAFEAMVF